MGRLVFYLTTKSRESLGNFFEANYKDFRQWCVNKADYADMLSTETQDFLIENESLPVFSEMSRDILDDLVIHFINTYCGIIKTGLLEMRNPFMKRDHYVEAKIELEKKCSEKTLELWNYLLNGRTLLDGNELAVSNSGRRLGYWTVPEQKHLQNELKKVFGKVSTINGIRFAQQVLEETVPENTELIILSE